MLDPEIGYEIRFQISLFIVLPDRFRCQPGPLTQFTLRDLSEEGDVPFRRVIRRNYSPRRRINTPCCQEVNGDYDGEGFISFRYTVLGYIIVKLTEFVPR